MTSTYRTLLIWLLLMALSLGGVFHGAPTKIRAQTVSSGELVSKIDAFLAREVALHFGKIETLNPPPDRVFSALTVGEFSWGSFARALAAQADLGGSRTIAGKDTARAIAEMGLYESRQGGKAFSQLYSTLALRHYGKDLSKNAVWLSMNDGERREWRSLLDATRFYDAKKRAVINLPENYLGVAARVAAMSFEMEVLKDRAFLDSVVERAAEQFTKGALYSDDNPPTGRYDRYSNEYARFCWDAAHIAGREDIKEKLRRTLKHQMKIWWDLVSPEGYGYNWGRSQGLVSYLDTLEIAAFLGENREFRPAPLAELAALYNQAWRWIRADYDDETHMFRVFAYGRGNYSYINPKREWQQTGTAFGKIILANNSLGRALEREKIARFPATPTLPDVARFDYFEKSPDRQLGVWLFRKGNMQFALPVTVGTKPGIADYLPAPFGLAGVAAPVEEVYPSLVPFVTLADGKTYSASDGADEIVPRADGLSLKTRNGKWAEIGGKSGERKAIQLVSEVEWRVSGGSLARTEKLTATSDAEIRSWKFALPSTASKLKQTGNSFLLEGREGTLKADFETFAGVEFSVIAAGDSKLGKGVLGANPSPCSRRGEEHQNEERRDTRLDLNFGIVELTGAIMIDQNTQFAALVTHWDLVKKEQTAAGIQRQMVVGQNVMMCRFTFDPFVVTPEHTHPHEQMTLVVKGKVKFTVENEVTIVSPGDVLHFPPHNRHGATMLDEEVVLIDIFSPIREDFLPDGYSSGNGLKA